MPSRNRGKPTTPHSWMASFTALFNSGALYAAHVLIDSEINNWASLVRKAGMTLD